MKLTVMSGYFACKIYSAGSVNIAPATITPEQAPILCMITFCPKAPSFLSAPVRPTAMIEIGIAASNTWPTFSPRYAAAALKIMAISRPMPTE